MSRWPTHRDIKHPAGCCTRKSVCLNEPSFSFLLPTGCHESEIVLCLAWNFGSLCMIRKFTSANEACAMRRKKKWKPELYLGLSTESKELSAAINVPWSKQSRAEGWGWCSVQKGWLCDSPYFFFNSAVRRKWEEISVTIKTCKKIKSNLR